MITHRIAVLIAAVLLLSGCEKSPPTPGPESPRTEVERRADVGASETRQKAPEAPQFNELPEERPFDPDEVVGGLKRLESCGEYNSYASRALVAYHLRRRFADRYGESIRLRYESPRVGAPLRSWGVDGKRAYGSFDNKFYVVDGETSEVQLVVNPMYTAPAMQNVEGGFVFLGRTGWLSGLGDTFVRFEEPKVPSGWGHYRDGRKKHYQQYQRANFEVYGPAETGVKFSNTMSMTGRSLGVHVATDARAAFFVQLTEVHVDAAAAEQARKIEATEFDEAKKLLKQINVKTPEASRPNYSWQLNPMNTGSGGSFAHLECDEIWVPNDRDTFEEHILVIHRFDLESRQYQTPLAVAVEPGFEVAMGGDRVYLVRRLHGAQWPDGTMDRPLSELSIFEIGETPRLLNTHRLKGVPVGIRASGDGAVVTTTRGHLVERLVYTVVDDEISGEPVRREPEFEPAVAEGDVPEFVWERGFVSQDDLVFVVADRVVRAVLGEDELRLVGYEFDGTEDFSASIKGILLIKPEEVLVGTDFFILPARASDDTDALIGRLADGELKLSTSPAHRGTAPRLALDDGLIGTNRSSVVWLSGEGEVQKTLEWKELTSTPAGRPTNP